MAAYLITCGPQDGKDGSATPLGLAVTTVVARLGRKLRQRREPRAREVTTRKTVGIDERSFVEDRSVRSARTTDAIGVGAHDRAELQIVGCLWIRRL